MQAKAERRDIRMAYRMILGRNPNEQEFERLLEKGLSVWELRSQILNSQEFGQAPNATVAASRMKASFGRQKPRLRDMSERRVIYLHIPKCGGTTMHGLLTQWYGKENVHSERFNRLYHAPAADLAHSLVFSGHYDFYSTQFVPGNTFRLSFLRDPMERLISLYHFHRAHSPEIVERNNLVLARWAQENDIDAYFSDERVRAHASIDNTMARHFSNIPQVPHAGLGDISDRHASIEQMYVQAKANIELFDLVGFMDLYDESVGLLADMLNKPTIDEIRSEQVLDDLMERGVGIRRIERQSPSKAILEQMEELVSYDRKVYDAAERVFRPRIEMHSAKRRSGEI
ncbi:Sulfotransferase family protein [Jannaschia aquimarina]|uniref:Sulfotransferase family protein n=2 Tax=Jannaschia aquimarina TaxID=935700 RepID=A0A0D1D542_9RHOB|nr:Sulfotransferase family protein [Jannaschia aquimarina]SNS65441.1 Sulfotransferase family protein [Jannaschia aquimarina]